MSEYLSGYGFDRTYNPLKTGSVTVNASLPLPNFLPTYFSQDAE